jgi:pyruvate-formate lyase-activating enzyme
LKSTCSTELSCSGRNVEILSIIADIGFYYEQLLKQLTDNERKEYDGLDLKHLLDAFYQKITFSTIDQFVELLQFVRILIIQFLDVLVKNQDLEEKLEEITNQFVVKNLKHVNT